METNGDMHNENLCSLDVYLSQKQRKKGGMNMNKEELFAEAVTLNDEDLSKLIYDLQNLSKQKAVKLQNDYFDKIKYAILDYREKFPCGGPSHLSLFCIVDDEVYHAIEPHNICFSAEEAEEKIREMEGYF
jgi:hypothetical protein